MIVINYLKYDINGIEVYLVKNNKYKTIKLNVIFINDYKKEDFTIQKLLSGYQTHSTNNYKNELDLLKRAVELYDINYSISNMYLNKHLKKYSLSFINEKYTEKGMNEKSIDFLFDIILNINTKNSKENFILSKNKLTSIYKRQFENQTYKAETEASSYLSYDVPLKYRLNGNLEDLKKIEFKDMLEFYKKEITSSNIKVFLTGNINEKDILKYLEKNMLKLKSIGDSKINPFIIKEKTINKKEKITEENNNQSIFIKLYKFLNVTDYEKESVLPLFNEILGGSNSKLFINIREKNSLAYYIYSSVFTFQSTLFIESGISKENYKKVNELIEKEIENMKKGIITKDELISAKEKIKNNVISFKDSQNSILTELEDIIIYDLNDSDRYLENIMKVTKEDIVKLASKLDLDVNYLLKGVK